ncbi:hypothetical protein BH23PLA1_BH23PLA1_07710 [soil metagenome]
MRDFAFYNAGGSGSNGPRRVLALARRILRRVLRPIFFRQEEIFRELQGQIDELARRREELAEQVHDLARQLDATTAFGWDYVAMARRLAALEDRIEAASPVGGPLEVHQGHGEGGIPAAHLRSTPAYRRATDPL